MYYVSCGSNGVVSLITWAGCFRNALYVSYVGLLLKLSLVWYWPLMHGINPQAGWLWGSILTMVYELLCKSWPQNLPYQSLVPASLLLDMLLDPALRSSEAGYWVFWFRVFWEGLWHSPMSGAALDWSWEPLLEQSRCGFFCIFLVMRFLFG